MSKRRLNAIPLALAALLAVHLGTPLRLSAQNTADLLFPGDPEYERLFLAALQAGRIPPTNTFPVFGNWGQTPRTPTWGLTPSPTPADAEASSLLQPPTASLTWTFSTPSLYYDSPAAAGDLAANLLADPDLTPRSFPEIQHFLMKIPDPVGMQLILQPNDSISAYMELQASYRRDRLTGQDSTLQWTGTEWLGNLFGAIESPRRAWLSMAGNRWGLTLGRFPAGMGWGRLSGSLLNPRASWYDQARIWLDSGNIRFTSMLATSSAQLSEAEREIQFRRKNDDGSFWDPLNDHDAAAADLAIKLATWHQLEWQPVPWLSFGFAEMGITGGRVPSFNFVLPTLIWHNTYASGYANVAAALNAAIVPLPGLLVSGEFLVDDTRSSDEPAYAKPNSYAWQTAMRWSPRLPPRDSIRWGQTPGPGSLWGLTPDTIDISLEYQHVDRWTYVRWQPYLSMYQRQTLTGGYYGLDQSLGAPWGPDSDSVGLSLQLGAPLGWQLELRGEFVRKGPIYQGMGSLQAVTADFDGDPLTADTTETIWVPVYYDYDKYAGDGSLAAILARPDEYRYLFSLEGSLPLRRGLWLETAATLGFYQNFGNVAGAEETILLAYLGFKAELPNILR